MSVTITFYGAKSQAFLYISYIKFLLFIVFFSFFLFFRQNFNIQAFLYIIYTKLLFPIVFVLSDKISIYISLINGKNQTNKH